MEYCKRAIEDVVRKADSSFKSILVSGARQTGKTTMLKKLFGDRTYILLDDPFLVETANQDPQTFLQLNKPPVILDEVQHTPGLFPFIKIACDNAEQYGQFCLSGSQPLALMEKTSESLAGRVCILELSTLSQREINQESFTEPFLPTQEYLSARHQSVPPPTNLWERIHRGGYPALQDPHIDWNLYFGSYVASYLERDVRSLSAVHDLSDFRRFMVAVAARTAQIVNYSSIANEIGKDLTTVKAWMSILETSGIIFRLEPYAPSVLRKALKTPKIFFRDTGLAAYLSRWLTPETLAYGAMNGAFFETFVISEIIKSYSNRGLDYRYFLSYYRGRDRKNTAGKGSYSSIESEIDLIIEENGILHPIAIKMRPQVSADMASAFTVLDGLETKKRGMGAIICTAPQPGTLRENILQIPVSYI